MENSGPSTESFIKFNISSSVKVCWFPTPDPLFSVYLNGSTRRETGRHRSDQKRENVIRQTKTSPQSVGRLSTDTIYGDVTSRLSRCSFYFSKRSRKHVLSLELVSFTLYSVNRSWIVTMRKRPTRVLDGKLEAQSRQILRLRGRSRSRRVGTVITVNLDLLRHNNSRENTECLTYQRRDQRWEIYGHRW